MPPAGPKSDINRSGAEVSDFPAVCNDCLSATDNPFIQMIKEDRGMECKICTRPFTVFRWAADRTSRFKKTNICLTCARLKNCCQCCMLDLSFGLPIAVRDAALKLVAQGPSSGINKEYYAQNHEGALTDGQVPEEYDKTDAAARELLKKLAHSEPYYKKRRNQDWGGNGNGGEGASGSGGGNGDGRGRSGPGPIRNGGRGGPGGTGGRGGGERGDRGGARGRGAGRGGRGGGGRGGKFPSTSQLPPGPQDVIPPDDQSITSLFLTGVEDDLAEHHIRTFFTAFGPIKSIVCVHRSRCAFVNFQTRSGAEAAAASCQGKAVISGCPLRIQWGRTRPLGNIDRSQAAAIGRSAAGAVNAVGAGGEGDGGGAGGEEMQGMVMQRDEFADLEATLGVRPPGKDDAQYPSQLAT